MKLFGDPETHAVLDVLDGQILNDPFDTAASRKLGIEDRFAQEFGGAGAVLVTSGSAALICSLVAGGVQEGDKVIVPAYANTADALAVEAIGATPVIVDIDDTLTIDPTVVESHLSDRTRAILAVHMNGRSCNVGALQDVCRRRNLILLEDACQAIGVCYKRAPDKPSGLVVSFSFNQFKILSAGTGGMVLCKAPEIYERAYMAHDLDSSLSQKALQFKQALSSGLPFRANEVTAALVSAQLDRLDNLISILAENYRKMTEMVAVLGIRIAHEHLPARNQCSEICIANDDEISARKLANSLQRYGFSSWVASDHNTVYSDWNLLRRAVRPVRASHADVITRTTTIVATPCDSRVPSDGVAGRSKPRAKRAF